MKRLFICTIVIVLILSVWPAIQYYAPPPPLGQKRGRAYKPIIVFAAQHEDWDFIYAENAYLKITNHDISLSNTERKDLMYQFQIWLEGTSTIRVYRKHDLIFFTLEPRFPLMWTPSYIYSPHGVDPRNEYDYLLNISRPIYSLGNNWYYSKNMGF